MLFFVDTFPELTIWVKQPKKASDTTVSACHVLTDVYKKKKSVSFYGRHLKISAQTSAVFLLVKARLPCQISSTMLQKKKTIAKHQIIDFYCHLKVFGFPEIPIFKPALGQRK